jgi:SnoaL-like domain
MLHPFLRLEEGVMMETHMVTESKTDRRSFLAAALAATGSALTSSVCQAEAKGQEPQSQAHVAAKFPLSFDSLYDTSVLATTLKGEAADRLALRRLVDAWARCADRRLAEEQSNLFVEDGTILNYEGDPATHKPHSTIKGRVAIRTALAVLNKFTVTLHMNGQIEVAIQGDHAIGESYCLAHEFWAEADQRKFQTLGIRYHDQFLRQEHRWYFVERQVIIDWSDTRTSLP